MQRKLAAGKKTTDSIRHEMLSYLLLLHGMDPKLAINGAGKNKQLDRPENLVDALYYAVASHHKLFQFDGNTLTQGNHTLVETADMKLIKGYVGCDEFKEAKRLHKHIESIEAFKSQLSFPQLLVAILFIRNSLMLSDHYVSSRFNTTSKIKKGELLAKSPEFGNESLKNHLRSVGHKAKVITKQLTRVKSYFKGIPQGELAVLLAQSTGKFSWQNKAVELAKNVAKNNSGKFIVMPSQTGSGKTIAAAKTALAINPNGPLRLSVLLGLRTLTLQTGDSYMNDLGLGKETVSTLIGSRETQAMHDADNNQHDSEIEIDSQGGIALDKNVPVAFKGKARNNKERSILLTPVLISTVDYLIKAGDWRRSKHLLPQLRLMSSDIVLDEVDGYDPQDIKAIMRLCFLTGMFGRNVILTTATAMPAIIEALYNAYSAGRRCFGALHETESNVDFLYLGDLHATVKQFDANDTNDARTWLHQQNAMTSEKINEITPKIKSIHKAFYLNNLGRQLHNSAAQLHETNHIIDDDGVRVSCGLIRIAHIKNAYKALREMEEYSKKLQGLKTTYVLYHSRMFMAVRSHLERELDAALKRKGDRDPLLDSHLYHHAKSLCTKDEKDIMIVVIATPVEEVGRDHDFDWAIIEPSSSRSVVQTAGRVLRHRDKIPTHPNVIIMKRNFHLMCNPKDTKYAAYSRPGFETHTKIFTKDGRREFDALAPYFAGHINAAKVIMPEAGTLAAMENDNVASILKEYEEHLCGDDINSFLADDDQFFTTFRDQEENYTFFISPKERLLQLDDTIADRGASEEPILADEHLFINDHNIEDIILSQMELLGITDSDEFHLRYMRTQFTKNRNLIFSTALGLLYAND